MERVQPHHGFGTHAIHAYELDDPYGAHTTPVYQSSVFEFPNVETGQELFLGRRPGYIYTRWGNPTIAVLERRMAALESLDIPRRDGEPAAEGLAFASGMAAITAAVLACCEGAGTLVAQEGLYGGTVELFTGVLPRFGVRVAWFDGTRPETCAARLEAHRDVGAVYIETPANPTLKITDIRAIVEFARAGGARVVSDNTFASPLLQRPLALGADIVVHSATKYLSGHGHVMGGVVVGRDPEFVRRAIEPLRRHLGAVPSPFDAWLILAGLKTLHLRVPRHCANARAIAEFLAEDDRVAAVHYPGLPSHPQRALAARQMSDFGGMLAFELRGGYAAAVAFMNALRLCAIAPSLGSLATLVQHPASMSHLVVPREERERAGIGEALIRMSVGVEEVDDVLGDLRQALDAAARA